MPVSFFEFLQYSLGIRQTLPESAATISWPQFYKFAAEQTLLGVCFDGIQRMSNDGNDSNPVPPDLLTKWMAKVERIKRSNIHVNKTCAKLFGYLEQERLNACILKGQGNTILYPNVYSRTPGDIDVWINAPHKEMEAFERKYFGDKVEKGNMHDGAYMDGVHVEMHFYPNRLRHPLYNRRLQKWFGQYAAEQCFHFVQLPDGVGRIAIPTPNFNLVYQLGHLQRHFLGSGLGLRQIIDYYMVMQAAQPAPALADTVHHLGMDSFAAALMYVLHEVLALPEERMIVDMNEKNGKALLADILSEGNFGRGNPTTLKAEHYSHAHRYLIAIGRDLHLMRHFLRDAWLGPFIMFYEFFAIRVKRLLHRTSREKE